MCIRDRSRTKRVAQNRAIVPEAWTPELSGAWTKAQELVAQAVALSHPRAGCAVLMFPDASDLHWGMWTVGHLSSVVESTDLLDACIRIAGYKSR